VHVKAVSERLGHASSALTMDTYGHSLATVQEQAAAKLEELFTKGDRG
jgi:integrase